jgi:hypothetical protein
MNEATAKRIIILGTHSFVDGGTKVGSQHLAEGLAAIGWEVAYVATASSLVDVWGSKRHPRLRRVWFGRQDVRGVQIAPGLTEFAFKAAIPAHRLFLRKRWQLATFGWFLPAWVHTSAFDVCISDVTPNMVFLPWIKAKHRVLRLNDWPAGFKHDVHPTLINYMEAGLRQASFDEVWAVSNPLSTYARELNSTNTIVLMPNGVELPLTQLTKQSCREVNSAIYIGGLTAWLDLALLQQVARLLPQWTIHVYGPGSERMRSDASNLHFHGAVSRTEVATLLARHEVGLIPFKNADDRMQFVERPLKFYEYVAAGLGVASTDHGALRSGMGDLAAYGNSPEEFAQAIVEARLQSTQRPSGFAQQFAQENAWPEVVAKAEHQLKRLLQGGEGFINDAE